MEDGYFTRVAVPRALAGSGELTPPVGIHPGLAHLIAVRVERGLAGRTPADVVLIGHGSARTPGRRTVLHDHAERLRPRFPAVRVALLEEAPGLPDVLAASPAGRAVAVVGIFAGEGGHVRDDLPRLMTAARVHLGDDLIDLGSIGDDAGMAGLILEMCRHRALKRL
jgi:sirohydrochlorin ferrochelatase